MPAGMEKPATKETKPDLKIGKGCTLRGQLNGKAIGELQQKHCSFYSSQAFVIECFFCPMNTFISARGCPVHQIGNRDFVFHANISDNEDSEVVRLKKMEHKYITKVQPVSRVITTN